MDRQALEAMWPGGRPLNPAVRSGGRYRRLVLCDPARPGAGMHQQADSWRDGVQVLSWWAVSRRKGKMYTDSKRSLRPNSNRERNGALQGQLSGCLQFTKGVYF